MKIKFIVSLCIAVLLALVLAGPLHSGEKKEIKAGLAKLIHMSLQDAVDSSGLVMKDNCLVEEPVGSVRGVRGVDKNGEQLFLYVNKGKFKSGKKWTLEELMDKPVIGAAIKHNGEWFTKGKVARNYHWNRH